MIQRRYLLGGLVILAGLIGFLVWNNLSDNLVYYLTPTEAVEQRSSPDSAQRFRLGGLVESGSLQEQANQVVFAVGDGANTITVVHTGAPPQLFREGVGVVVEGAWQGEQFRSDLLLINHDEQYRAPEGDEPYQIPETGA